MNKSQGLAVGAALAAALLLRPTSSNAPQGPETSEIASSAAERSASAHKGPWIASYNYWASARQPGEAQPNENPEAHATLEVKSGHLNLHARVSETDEEESACGNDPPACWGFPKHHEPIDLTALIATVPDPVHTHLALTFDRTIAAMLDAANDNNYVSSYHWLPWKNRIRAMKGPESAGDGEPGHDPEREREPGLLILRPGRAPPPGSFNKVIYIFLVAETPARGVDGFQLQRAFLYEKQLKSALKADDKFSTGAKCSIAIIGPNYSGSSVSMRAAIEAARKNANLAPDTQFDLTGATSTQLAVAKCGVSAFPTEEDRGFPLSWETKTTASSPRMIFSPSAELHGIAASTTTLPAC
jgi:hypothetical protein